MTVKLQRCVKRGILLLSRKSMVLLYIIYQKGKQLREKCLLLGVFRALMVLPITWKSRKCIIICIQMYRPILDLYLPFSLVALANFTCWVGGNTDIIAENWKMTRQSATDYNSCEAEGWDHWTKAKKDETRARTTNALGRTWEEGFENWHKVEVRMCSSKTLFLIVFSTILFNICTYNLILFKITIDKTHCHRKLEKT